MDSNSVLLMTVVCASIFLIPLVQLALIKGYFRLIDDFILPSFSEATSIRLANARERIFAVLMVGLLVLFLVPLIVGVGLGSGSFLFWIIYGSVLVVYLLFVGATAAVLASVREKQQPKCPKCRRRADRKPVEHFADGYSYACANCGFIGRETFVNPSATAGQERQA